MHIEAAPKRRVGRPRTVSLEPEEMIKLGEKMLSWIEENNPIHITQWYSMQMGISKKDWEAMQQMPEFLPYYECAMRAISINYIDGTVNASIAHRFMRRYFREVKEEENEESQFKSKLASDNNSQVSEEARQQLNALNTTLKSLQESAVNKLKEIRQSP